MYKVFHKHDTQETRMLLGVNTYNRRRTRRVSTAGVTYSAMYLVYRSNVTRKGLRVIQAH